MRRPHQLPAILLPVLVLVLLRPRLEHVEALDAHVGRRRRLRLAAGALAEAAYLGDTLEPSDSEDEMEAESDLDNGDEEITDLVSDGENA